MAHVALNASMLTCLNIPPTPISSVFVWSFSPRNNHLIIFILSSDLVCWVTERIWGRLTGRPTGSGGRPTGQTLIWLLYFGRDTWHRVWGILSCTSPLRYLFYRLYQCVPVIVYPLFCLSLFPSSSSSSLLHRARASRESFSNRRYPYYYPFSCVLPSLFLISCFERSRRIRVGDPGS